MLFVKEFLSISLISNDILNLKGLINEATVVQPLVKKLEPIINGRIVPLTKNIPMVYQMVQISSTGTRSVKAIDKFYRGEGGIKK